jgi:hypothetical protein
MRHPDRKQGEKACDEKEPSAEFGLSGQSSILPVEVFAGSLQCVEQESSSSGVNFVGDDEVHEVKERVVEVGAAGGQRDADGFALEAAGAALVNIYSGLAGWVVVEAEGLTAEGR